MKINKAYAFKNIMTKFVYTELYIESFFNTMIHYTF